MGSVIAVSGAVGGIGTSTLAYAIALQCAPTSVLIDAQLSGAPIELLIGGESETGTRWHQIHISSSTIAAETIRNALPRWNGVLFLSASRHGAAHVPALNFIIDALRSGPDAVIVDIDAHSAVLDVLQPELHVLVVPNTIYGLGAVPAGLRDRTVLAVVRTELEDFRPDEIGHYLSQPVLGVIEHERSVWMALRARKSLPPNSSVMRIAELVTTRIADAA